MIKKSWKPIFSIAFITFLVGYSIMRPNGWNTIYYELGPKKYEKGVDSVKSPESYSFKMIPHTFFEWGSSPYRKYRRGDTVAVLENGKIVGEMKMTGGIWHLESTSLWMKPE